MLSLYELKADSGEIPYGSEICAARRSSGCRQGIFYAEQLRTDGLSDSERELVAKALECGYLRKQGVCVEPKLLVLEKAHETEFRALSAALSDGTEALAEAVAEELSAFMRARIPAHLLNEYPLYTQLIAGVRILARTIETCITAGLLAAPEGRLGAEGVLMIVEK